MYFNLLRKTYAYSGFSNILSYNYYYEFKI